MINKLMKKKGYEVVREDKYGVEYEKYEQYGDFTHKLVILHKVSGNHILQSYDKEVLQLDGMYLNEGCGVEISVLLLMWLKAQYLKIKYRW